MDDMIGIAFRAFQNRQQIARIVELLQPAIDELKHVAPDVIALAREVAPAIFTELREGIASSGPLASFEIKWLQASLKKLGHEVEVDGVFGAKTEKAVALFQVAQSMKQTDGWPTMATCVAIYNALEKK